MSSVLNCGVVGFGLAGRIFHSAVISAVPGLRLAAVVERSDDAARQSYPDARIYRTASELFADASIDLAVIATPNLSHQELTEQALRAGKHVVVDKPLTTDSQGAARLASLAREQNRLLLPYQNRRWDGDFLTLRSLIEDDRLGALVTFESHFDRFRPQLKPTAWRERDEPGSGILFDLGSHLVDQALALFGKPSALMASVRSERPGAVTDDAFDLTLSYSGAGHSSARVPRFVILRSSSLAAMPAFRFELRGTEASYRKWGLDPQEDALRSGDLFVSQPWGVELHSAWGTLTRWADGAPISEAIPTLPGDYRAFYENVRDAIRGTHAPAVTPVEAWRTLRVLEMARESSRQQQRVECDWSGEPV